MTCRRGRIPAGARLVDGSDTAVEFLRQQARLASAIHLANGSRAATSATHGRLPVDPHADPTWSESVLQDRRHERRHVGTGTAASSTTRTRWPCVCTSIAPGISYNLAFYERVRPEYSTERMICFADYPDGRATAAATYAHELLHLFGAGDLYFPYDSTPDREGIGSPVVFPAISCCASITIFEH